ncbi:hypothetical protein BRC82_09705 [Halobacteriales archaeon QS_1_67_19]|nr:MAG: hypothetical protein BRC82_09705 [Halobacteriales archaeon QS_1_67_19]
MYLLSEDQRDRQRQLETGYEISEYTSIATELQDECERMDGVLYPVHIESDAFPEVCFETTIDYMTDFIEEELNVSPGDCTFYFSGNRSIHAHVPKFITREDNREQLKECAEEFNDERGAEFDLGLYSRKRQFRLPGVTHEKTGLPKVEIEPEWEHDEIIQTASKSNPILPDTYGEVIDTVFGEPGLTIIPNAPDDEQRATRNQANEWAEELGGPSSVVSFGFSESSIEVPLIEQAEQPSDPTLMPEWASYNTHPFSPYANASGNPRSVAVVKVKGGAFARDEVTIGGGSRPVHALVPAYFYGAISCDGEFTKDRVHAPLQLSKQDYRKWESRGFEPGEKLVIIGGKSGSSIIFHVSSWEATEAGHALTSEVGNRQKALDYLANRGYHIGSGGTGGSTSSTGKHRAKQSDRIRPVQNPQTLAAELQHQAEQDGVESLEHDERRRVAFRVLKIGSWHSAWEWFETQYGEDFKPEYTRKEFVSVIEAKPEDYAHIEVPDKPN